MAISPQVLQSISNPAQGLSSIGTAFLQGQKYKQDKLDRETARTQLENKQLLATRKQDLAESKAGVEAVKLSLDVKKNAREQAKFDEEVKLNKLEKALQESKIDESQINVIGDQARINYALTTQILNDVSQMPEITANPESYKNYIEGVTENLPDDITKQIKKSSLDQIKLINRRSKRMDDAINKLKPTYETVTLQNKKTGELKTLRKSNPAVDQLISNAGYIKYFPSQKGTAGDVGLQKKTRGKIEDVSLFAADLQDSVAELEKLFSKGGSEKLTVWDAAYDVLASGSERLGIDIPEKSKESVKLRQQMQGNIVKVQNNWRKAITGSQASKFELKKIESQIMNLDDSGTVFKTKLSSWKDTADKMAVRAKKALDAGFKNTGSVKKSNGDIVPIYSNENGEVKTISQFGALDKIPTKNEYMARELQSSYPIEIYKNMTDKEKNDAIKKVSNSAKLLGYR